MNKGGRRWDGRREGHSSLFVVLFHWATHKNTKQHKGECFVPFPNPSLKTHTCKNTHLLIRIGRRSFLNHDFSYPCLALALLPLWKCGFVPLSLSLCVCTRKWRSKDNGWQKGRQMERRSGPGGVHKWEMRGAAEANMAQKLSLISNQEGERYWWGGRYGGERRVKLGEARLPSSCPSCPLCLFAQRPPWSSSDGFCWHYQCNFVHKNVLLVLFFWLVSVWVRITERPFTDTRIFHCRTYWYIL